MSMSTSVMTILKLKGTLHQMDTTMIKTLVPSLPTVMSKKMASGTMSIIKVIN